VTPQTGTALLILALFVLPGFVTLLLRERMFAVRDEVTSFERLLNALYYSAVVYAIVLGAGALLGLDKGDVVGLYNGRKSLEEDLLAAALIALALPMSVALAGLWWRASDRIRPWVLALLGISPSHTVSSGWNEAFGRTTTQMLRVTLRDGRVVGGYFGDGSLAGYSEQAQDLFIAERWSIDPATDWFTEKAAGNEGLWTEARRSSQSSSTLGQPNRQPNRMSRDGDESTVGWRRYDVRHVRRGAPAARRKARRLSAAECRTESEKCSAASKRLLVQRETAPATDSLAPVAQRVMSADRSNKPPLPPGVDLPEVGLQEGWAPHPEGKGFVSGGFRPPKAQVSPAVPPPAPSDAPTSAKPPGVAKDS
jgi:Family of unknown function (DUF6338)